MLFDEDRSQVLCMACFCATDHVLPFGLNTCHVPQFSIQGNITVPNRRRLPLLNPHDPLLFLITFIILFIVLWIILHSVTSIYQIEHLPCGGWGCWWADGVFIIICHTKLGACKPNLAPLYSENSSQWLTHRICPPSVWWVSEYGKE